MASPHPAVRPPVEATAGLAVLRQYRPAWLRGDLFAGLTIGALLITQCMAYAPLAGLPPSAAFHAVLVALPVYALVGTSRHLVVGPDPGTAAVAGAGLAAVATVGSDDYLAAAAALGLMVGVVLVLAGLLRLGLVADLLSRPALIGYLTGLGVILLVGQVPKLLGIPVDAETTVAKVGEILTSLGEIDPATAAMGLGTLALILGLKYSMKGLPAAVIGVVAATVVAWVFSLDEHGIGLVGDFDADVGLPALPGIPIQDWGALVPTAIAVAVLGYADSFLTAKGVAGKQGYDLDADRELTGLGAANVAAGAFQGMPVASTGSGTAAASAAGGVTQVTFLIAAALVLAGILFLGPVIERIPSAALAAVVTSAAVGLFEIPGFRLLWRESRLEFLLALATFAAVIVFGVLAGILISIGLGLLIALVRVARPHDAILGRSADLDGWVDADDYDTTAEEGLLVYRFDAPLFFVNASRFAERVEEVLEENPGEERWVVLDFEGVGSVDTTATEVLAGLADDLRRHGVEVVGLARANGHSLDRLRRAGLLEPGGPFRVFPTINGAVRAFQDEGGGPPT
ncbi:MAG: SulP family inorganic anion transporter [Acidimicrobiales bacterium]|nr:SulP family inorganic anion transporter [Acidimicrobiales bacterium]